MKEVMVDDQPWHERLNQPWDADSFQPARQNRSRAR
jgi:hypothetical protein